ncbi:hypothetical protein [Stella sp.]|uniref:hypothetical protein n=1 Tax=Stella sp. TaxID=2912054 RepID=UPI0035AE56C9
MTRPEFPYDRARLLDALARLGSDDEETVLAAARAADAILATARLGWDDLLAPAAPPAAPDAAAPAPVDDAGRIAALLALPDLSADSRETLEEMARELAAGTVRDADRTWLQALHARLVGA